MGVEDDYVVGFGYLVVAREGDEAGFDFGEVLAAAVEGYVEGAVGGGGLAGGWDVYVASGGEGGQARLVWFLAELKQILSIESLSRWVQIPNHMIERNKRTIIPTVIHIRTLKLTALCSMLIRHHRMSSWNSIFR